MRGRSPKQSSRGACPLDCRASLAMTWVTDATTHRHCEEQSGHRHCEEAATRLPIATKQSSRGTCSPHRGGRGAFTLDCRASLAMTWVTDATTHRHCEERSGHRHCEEAATRLPIATKQSSRGTCSPHRGAEGLSPWIAALRSQ
ncbi:MAG: hypothetical protein LBT00_16195 [Spirochaetaceae bacterium]|nr:hypothetical protein [Spirochaetaceae bacterium]